MAKRLMRWTMALMVAGLLTACGGSGGGGDSLFGENGASAPGGGASAPGTGTATASNLVLASNKGAITNSGSDSALVTVTALDSSNNTVAGAAIALTVDSNAIVAKSAPLTGTAGTLTGTVLVGDSRANRTITVTASVGNVSKSITLQVTGATLTSTLLPPVIEPGAVGKVQYLLVDALGVPMVGEPFTVTGAGLAPAERTGTTGPSGEFAYDYTAPATAGSYAITATAGGASPSTPDTLQVQTATSVPTVTETITSASVSANPSVVGVNAGSATTNRSEIRALFLSNNNLPIRNVRVRFDLAGDVNSIGGSFSTATSLVYSDVNGVASAAYIAGSRSSPTDGVTVRACYSEADFSAGACPKSATVKLTVSSEPLGVSIGTNELIIVNELTYVKKYVVTVVDSAGVAKPDVNLAVSVDLTNYRKGSYRFDDPAESWVKNNNTVCPNEDRNRNGVLESGENTNGAIALVVPGALPSDPPQFNTRLDPGKSDVSVSLLQVRTRADGTAELQVQYAKSFGTWVDAVITVAASGVSGTEGRASASLQPIPVDTESLKNKDQEPAYIRSPFGVTGSGNTLADCPNPN